MHKLELPAAPMLCSGHAACPGCVEALSVRHLLAVIGTDAMAVIPPSCMAIIAGAQPYSSLRIPVYQPTLESSAAAASGLRRALDAQGRHETQVIVLAGDGGTYDIGFQCLSSAAERNENILYFCLDNEGYMNTGAQKSSSTPHYAHTSSTPAGKTTRKKNLTEIMAAHQVPYAATASVGYLDDMVRKVEKAKAMRGFRIITLLVPCLVGWGLPDDGGLRGRRRRALYAQPYKAHPTGGRLPCAAAALQAPRRSDDRQAANRGRSCLGPVGATDQEFRDRTGVLIRLADPSRRTCPAALTVRAGRQTPIRPAGA